MAAWATSSAHVGAGVVVAASGVPAAVQATASAVAAAVAPMVATEEHSDTRLGNRAMDKPRRPQEATRCHPGRRCCRTLIPEVAHNRLQAVGKNVRERWRARHCPSSRCNAAVEQPIRPLGRQPPLRVAAQGPTRAGPAPVRYSRWQLHS
eukprot:4146564-Prymnesium_polylepis.1